MDTFALFTNQDFFESVEHYTPRPDYAEVLREILPDGWTLRHHGTWLHATDGQPILPQGFKIHVTSTVGTATEVLRTVAHECAAMRTTFKVAADVFLLKGLNSRYAPRRSSGKFITIYPRSLDDFRRLIARLHEVTRTEPFAGPYVLSDRRYRDSRVLSFRYGGFHPRSQLNVDGTRTPVIIDASGALVPDVRDVFYNLPPHVADPFAGEAWLDEQADEGSDGLLHGRYRIERPLRYSNAGGTYTATDTRTGRSVIVKEARPHTCPWTIGDVSFDACDMRRAEWAVLQRLRNTTCVPQPVDYFRAWEHEFLVEEFVEGLTYWSFWADRRNLLAPYVRRPDRVTDFLGKFRVIARNLLAAVREAHRHGVLLGDISPHNVMIRPEDLGVVIVDVDSAVILDGDDATSSEMAELGRQWHTPGFMRDGRAAGAALAPIDDWYAVGMMLYCAVIPVQSFFALRRAPDFGFLDMMIASGVPPRMRDLVRALVEGRADAADAMLATDDGWAAPATSVPSEETRP